MIDIPKSLAVSGRKGTKKLEVLHRRMAHLEQRLRTATQNLSYDREEKAALKWVIEKFIEYETLLGRNGSKDKDEAMVRGKEILEGANGAWRRLKNEAYRALILGDAAARLKKLVEATRIIVDLPERVKDLIPEEPFREILTLSVEAKRAIEDNGDFAMGVLLYEHGSQKGDPNILEKIIQKL